MRKAFRHLYQASFLPISIAAGIFSGLVTVQAQTERTASRLNLGDAADATQTPAPPPATGGAQAPATGGNGGSKAPAGDSKTPAATGGADSKTPGSASPASLPPTPNGPGPSSPAGADTAAPANPDASSSTDTDNTGAASTPEPGDQGDPLAPKADEAVDRPAILAKYAAIDDAFANQDIDKMLDETHSQDFEAIDREGKSQDFNGVHNALLDLFDKAKSAKVVTHVRVVTFKDNTATVEVRRHLDLSLVDSKTTENSLVTLDNYSRDFWIKDGDRWLEKRSRLLTSTRHVTGKPPTLLVTTW
jgi:hypothetical protein